MKKKEALYKIKNILDNLKDVCSHKLQSEAILNELERSGMLPPTVKKLKNYDNKIELVEDVNEWESE